MTGLSSSAVTVSTTRVMNMALISNLAFNAVKFAVKLTSLKTIVLFLYYEVPLIFLFSYIFSSMLHFHIISINLFENA
jgi:hypothetical protein